MRHLSAVELHDRLARKSTAPFVLDVREPWETAICSLPGSINIPMDEIPRREDELPADKDIVVVCHHGVRSLQVAYYLEHRGFRNLHNLTGGIDAWSRDVDPSTPTY